MANKTLNQNFPVTGQSALILENLQANVQIVPGQTGNITIKIEGEEKLLNLVSISQPDQSTVKITARESGNSITIIQRGRGDSISVVNISGQGTVIGRGNVVITNGRVVSGDEDLTVIKADKETTISVTVPLETFLTASNVSSLDCRSVNGLVELSLEGKNQAFIDGAVDPRLEAEGQAFCEIHNASGKLKGDAADQARLKIVGNFTDDVELIAAGQANVTASGSFADVDADASDMAKINIQGNCANLSCRASDMARISHRGVASGKIRRRVSDMASIDA